MDSDHAGDQDKEYSTTGVVLYLAGGPVDWRSVMRTAVAISVLEDEFVAVEGVPNGTTPSPLTENN